jgi:AraC family transcriptional regulator
VDWQERMNAAVDYLEAHLEEEIQWKLAAAEANCSTFHFLRMFEVVAGIPAGEYVRRRRLSLAALGLAAGNARVVDQALRAGYDSPDAFAKAFKREFGLAPSEARAPGIRLRTWPRFSFTVVLKGEQPMNFRIENHEAIKITGLPLRVSVKNNMNQKDIPTFWDRCKKDGTMEKLARGIPKGSKLGIMGVCAPDMDEKTQEFTYLIAVETPADGSSMPKGCMNLTAKACTWAIFESRGPMPKAIQDTWKRILSEWFPTSGYERINEPELEIYPEGDIDSAEYYCEVWLPVKKASKT